MKQGKNPQRYEKELLTKVGRDWQNYLYLNTKASIVTYQDKQTKEQLQISIQNPKNPEIVN